MKKIFPVLSIIALVLGMVAFIAPMAKAAEPAGTMAGDALTVDIGQLKAINALTITDAGGEITALNDIKIKIPAGVNAVWDQSDTTAVIDVSGATTGTVSATVAYDSATVVTLDVTDDFTAGDVVVVSGLSVIGHTAASGAASLVFAIDGAVYDTDGSTANVTVANGAEDTLTSVDISALDPVAGSTTNYTIVFTVPATGVIPPDGKIVVDFPAGFDTTGVTTVISATMTGALTIADIDGTGFTVTRDGTGTNALAGIHSIQLPNIVNGAAGTHSVTVSTTTATDAALASGTDAAHIIIAAPVAINDLTCEASGQAGAIWLRWTTPAGASISYTVKHALAAMTSDGEFNAGTTFSQSWSVGTVGSATQQLVTGLNPNTRYYFSVKSTGFGPTTSAISTPHATTCIAPAGAAALLDTTAPNTQITSPAGGSTVHAGQALKITGTALDSGGSSVQKIEVSLDGGSTWNNATVTGDDGVNVIWEYIWANAQAGTVNIKARAIDWTNNVESTPADITITVSSDASAATTSTTTTTTETTTTSTVAQLQTQLQTLRVQLLSLLMQLVAKLQAQLSAM